MTSEQANGLVKFSEDQLNAIQQRLLLFAVQSPSTRTKLILNDAHAAITFLRHELGVYDRGGRTVPPPPQSPTPELNGERHLVIPWPDSGPGRRLGVVVTALSDVANHAMRDGLSPVQTEIALRSVADAILSERRPT